MNPAFYTLLCLHDPRRYVEVSKDVVQTVWFGRQPSLSDYLESIKEIAK
jgi:hypothetical protein